MQTRSEEAHRPLGMRQGGGGEGMIDLLLGGQLIGTHRAEPLTSCSLLSSQLEDCLLKRTSSGRSALLSSGLIPQELKLRAGESFQPLLPLNHTLGVSQRSQRNTTPQICGWGNVRLLLKETEDKGLLRFP